MQWKRFRPSPSMVVASLALAVALGGTGYAAVVLPANSVGTAQLKNGAVVGAKVKNGSLSASSFRPGALPSGPAGPAGVAGPAGPAGPGGAKGDPATKLFAVVKGADGTIVRQSGGINPVQPKPAAAGLYTLIFPQSINGCAPVVTLSSTTASPEEGFASATIGGGPNQLNVQTFDNHGNHQNSTFSVAVFC